MKTKNKFLWLYALALSATAFTSCSVEDNLAQKNNDVKRVKKVITATMEENSEEGSRTTLAVDAGNKTYWATNDALKVFDGTEEGAIFTLIGEGGKSNSGEFDGSVAANATELYGVYPHDAQVTLDESLNGNITNLVIPAEQKATVGTFDPNATLMTAYTTDINMSFKNVCSLLKFIVPDSKEYLRVTVTSGDGEKVLAGQFTGQIDKDGITTLQPKTGEDDEIFKTVTLANNGETLESGTYYIALAPGDMKGISVKCWYADPMDQYDEFSIQPLITVSNFKRSRIVNLGSTDNDAKWLQEVKASHICTHYYKVDEATPQWIDMGTGDGVLWSTINLGAEGEDKYGDYYAWGATEPYCIAYDQDGANVSAESGWLLQTHWLKDREKEYDGSTWLSYMGYYSYNAPYTTNAGINYTRYNYTDGWNVLAKEDDAAHLHWDPSGTEGIVTPTAQNLDHLVKKCYWVWCDGETKKYKGSSIPGFCVFRIKDNSSVEPGTFASGSTPCAADYSLDSEDDDHIFLPAAGMEVGSNKDFSDTGKMCKYWSSTCPGTNANILYESATSTTHTSIGYPSQVALSRWCGLPIRPVKVKGDNNAVSSDYINKNGSVWE